jgi:hypothetical protein
VLTFGLNVDINAGLSMDRLEGEATITTGITATIPDSPVTKIDLLGQKAVDISGWIPQFTTDPITIEAEVDAEVELYTELAVAVSLLVLGMIYSLTSMKNSDMKSIIVADGLRM